MTLRIFVVLTIASSGGYFITRRFLRRQLRQWLDLAVLLVFLGGFLVFVIPEIGFGLFRLLEPTAVARP